MIVTNQTTADYWFGPLYLKAGVGQTLTVDDTTQTSLYLTDDSVANAINALTAAGKITVTSAALPFPRPTGSPAIDHGDGSPEGLVYAGQGSIYLRRDKYGVYQKATGIFQNTGWVLLGDDGVKPSSATFETDLRNDVDADLAVLATGSLQLQAIYLPANTLISSITCVSGGTAAGTPLNQWFALYDSSLNKLAVTADDTSTAWAANAAKTLSFATPFTTTYSGLYYIGVMVKATTVPTLAGANTRSAINALTPKGQGVSTTGLTNPASAPATAAAITAAAGTFYAYTA